MPRPEPPAYFPGLDGLRGVAIAMVVGLHGYDMTGWSLACCGGGSIGVDVFFVLSGFLITSLLVAEWERDGRIDLVHFYLRRALRLLPALLLVMAFLAFCVKGLGLYIRFDRWIAAATLGYFANWVVSLKLFDMGPMLHAWSLAVEEQFYLTWPPLLLAMLVRGSRRRTILAVLAGGIAFVTLARLGRAAPEGPLGFLFHLGDSRADGLLVGCGLALLWSTPRCLGPLRRLTGAGVASLLFLVASAVRPFPTEIAGASGTLLVGIATASVILDVVADPKSRVARALSWGPLVWLGRISYSLYLWHYPLIIVANRVWPDVPGRGFVVVAVSLAASAASFYLVEKPILGLKHRLARRAGAPRRVPERSQP